MIKILKDICDRRPDFDKIPQICVRILRRANDEESVKKLVVETFHGLWFLPVRERDTATLLKKVCYNFFLSFLYVIFKVVFR